MKNLLKKHADCFWASVWPWFADCVTLLGTNTYPLPFGTFEDDDFPFPKLGYVSFLAGYTMSISLFNLFCQGFSAREKRHFSNLKGILPHRTGFFLNYSQFAPSWRYTLKKVSREKLGFHFSEASFLFVLALFVFFSYEICLTFKPKSIGGLGPGGLGFESGYTPEN